MGVTSLADLPLRADLVGRSPYGAPQLHVPVTLNVNENTHPVPDEVREDVLRRVAAALDDVNRYPDREFTPLREALAGYLGHGLDPAQVWAANGSNEVLQHVFQAFGGPGRTLLTFPPTYSMYPNYAVTSGTAVVEGRRDDDFRLSPETVVAEIRRTRPDVVVLCAPNNPTGTPVGLDTVRAAYDATDGVVVVDEAYGEFMPPDAPSALTLLPGRPRLAVSRTMSKAFAFAGARLGYLAADPAFVDALRLTCPRSPRPRRSARSRTPRSCCGRSTRSGSSATAPRRDSRRSGTACGRAGRTSSCSAASTTRTGSGRACWTGEC
jgi:histidinol-phosphate aminotransferase